ncbi:MAG: acetylglutamate kinase, partial [Planctomycetota bacterium]
MTGPVVVKLGGSSLDAGAALWSAIVEAAAARPVVVVHGGGAIADRRLGAHGFTSTRTGGLRLTPAEHLGVVVGALAGEANTRVVSALNAAGARAVGLTLVDGGEIACVNAGLEPGDRVG